MKPHIFIILIIAAIFIAGINTASAAPIGSVLDFDGNDYLTVADSAVLDQANQLSLSVWVKPDTTPAADAYIIYRANAYYLKQNTSNQITAAIYYSAAFQTITSSALTLGKWTHIELTYNKDAGGTDELKLYINGVLSVVGDHSTAIADTNTALYIGCQNSTPTNCFDGKIDDFRLYQYDRTADEVKTDYNNGLAGHLGKDSQRDDGLVGFWNMEEGKGQTVYDRSGNSNNGTLGASTAVAKDDPVFTSGYSSSGPGGTALKFDGVNDYVVVNSGASLSSSNFTYSFWMNRKGSSGGNWGGLIEYLNRSSLTSRILFNDAGNNIVVQDAGTGVIYSSSLNNNQWYFITLTFNGTTPLLYVNGSLDKTGSTSTFASGTNNIKFGVGADWANTYYFSGSIDEVRIYNRALSADEIRQHYNQKKPILEMKFDEGSGTSTKDESFNNNDGTLYSGATVCSNPPTAGCPTWTQGKYGSAIQFDGTNDYVDVIGSLTVSNFTIMAWVRYDVLTTDDYWWGNDAVNQGIGFYQNRVFVWGFTSQSGKQGTTPTSANTWYHVALVRDNSGTKVYLNTLQELSWGDTGSFDILNTFNIGRATGCEFDGLIDEARIYNYARSAEEILVDYNNGLAAHLR